MITQQCPYGRRRPADAVSGISGGANNKRRESAIMMSEGAHSFEMLSRTS